MFMYADFEPSNHLPQLRSGSSFIALALAFAHFFSSRTTRTAVVIAVQRTIYQHLNAR
jgi:hypothetical protein